MLLGGGRMGDELAKTETLMAPPTARDAGRSIETRAKQERCSCQDRKESINPTGKHSFPKPKLNVLPCSKLYKPSTAKSALMSPADNLTANGSTSKAVAASGLRCLLCRPHYTININCRFTPSCPSMCVCVLICIIKCDSLASAPNRYRVRNIAQK